jgi:hypothetical protein
MQIELVSSICNNHALVRKYLNTVCIYVEWNECNTEQAFLLQAV